MSNKEIQTDTKAFKNWFGNSKVVDKNGNPLIVYHGTPKGEFNTFKYKGLKDDGFGGTGYYFHKDKQQGISYTQKWREFDDPYLFEVYLSLQNPFNYNTNKLTKKELLHLIDKYEIRNEREHYWAEIEELSYDSLDDGINKIIAMYLKEKDVYEQGFFLGFIIDREKAFIELGYDGFIIGEEYVAFYPEQIKSATKNSGNFDINNPNINMEEGGLTPSKARTMLEDGQAQGKPLTDKQKRYFGMVANKKMGKGGLTKGKSHEEGGIPMTVKNSGQKIEVEGGEGILNKHAMKSGKKYKFEGKDKTICEIASDLNQKEGGGVEFGCDNVDKADTSRHYANGGEIDERKERLWDERGYDYKHLDKLSEMELRSVYDTEFYYDMDLDEDESFNYYAKGGRPSPTASATDFPLGSLKVGNDSNIYIVTKRGKSQYWKKAYTQQVKDTVFEWLIDYISHAFKKGLREKYDDQLFIFTEVNENDWDSNKATSITFQIKHNEKEFTLELFFSWERLQKKFYINLNEIDPANGKVIESIESRTWDEDKFLKVFSIGNNSKTAEKRATYLANSVIKYIENKSLEGEIEEEKEEPSPLSIQIKLYDLFAGLVKYYNDINKEPKIDGGKLEWHEGLSEAEQEKWEEHKIYDIPFSIAQGIKDTQYFEIIFTLKNLGEIEIAINIKTTEDTVNIYTENLPLQKIIDTKNIDIAKDGLGTYWYIKRQIIDALLKDIDAYKPKFKAGDKIKIWHPNGLIFIGTIKKVTQSDDTYKKEYEFDKKKEHMGGLSDAIEIDKYARVLEDLGIDMVDEELNDLYYLKGNFDDFKNDTNIRLEVKDLEIFKSILMEEEEFKNNSLKENITKYYQVLTEPKNTKLERTTKKAPNGKQSFLTDYQYLLVRTQSFLEWFGDWMKASETGNYEGVSKVIHPETKEPLILYHGSRAKGEFTKWDFTKFNIAYFAENIAYAQEFSNNLLYEVFLNIKELVSFVTFQLQEETLAEMTNYMTKKYDINLPSELIAKLSKPESPQKFKFWILLRFSKSFRQYMKEQGYDGFVFFEDNPQARDMKGKQTLAYAIYSPAQVKLADGRNIGFSRTNPDIRFKKGGAVKRKKDKLSRFYKGKPIIREIYY